MKIKTILILSAAFLLLQACGSKGRMMHSDSTMDNDIQVAMVVINE